MSSLIIQLVAGGLGAAIGAWIGHARLLCSDGSCPLSGRWCGAALLGGVLTFSLAGSFIPQSRTAAIVPVHEETPQ